MTGLVEGVSLQLFTAIAMPGSFFSFCSLFT